MLYRGGGLTVVSDPTLDDDRRVMITSVGGEATIAALAPATAAKVLVRPVREESELRAALADAQVSMHPPDALFYFSLAAKADLLNETDEPNIRRLTEQDRDAFAAFASAAPAPDLDNAYVELDHWAVFGAFRGDEVVCAASMYPWGGSPLADLGVLSLPSVRRQGLARLVVRACCRYAYRHNHEPQYRTQLDNVASLALAASAGLTWFGQWEVASPRPPDD